jgi:6,7-dimethyl-8-ribityllumazine synthase
VDQVPHLLIVEARYYDDIGEELIKGAEAALTEARASFERIKVPGAFEIPAAIHMAVRSADQPTGGRRFDGFVALGCVIRGETSHYDYVCTESARKLQDLACEFTLALGYGILTCETREQAWARARVDGKDKGGEATRACLAMVELKRRFHLLPGQEQSP